jgi:hypothetical protein
MNYSLERLDANSDGSSARIIQTKGDETIFQTSAWLSFISKTQQGEPVIAALKEGRQTIGYFTGLIVRKFGLRILGSPFPGWSTDYMGFVLSSGVDQRSAVKALLKLAFHELGCVHVEVMDRKLILEKVADLGVQYRFLRGYEIDLTREEDELLSNMTSACRRCIRKAEKEEVIVEEAHDLAFAEEYYAQLQDVFAKQSLVPTYDVGRVRELIATLHPTGHLLLLRARDKEGRCIATGIFPHLNNAMYFWGGASWRQHQLSRPNEAIQWHAMKIAKKMGLRTYDMGGGGEYKRKYGGKEIQVPWLRKSKYPWVRYLRTLAQQGYRLRQQSLGFLKQLQASEQSRRSRDASEIRISSLTKEQNRECPTVRP